MTVWGSVGGAVWRNICAAETRAAARRVARSITRIGLGALRNMRFDEYTGSRQDVPAALMEALRR
eukprot:1420798-Pyramimonas_sp.AAC.1